jgi:hypothetical protein
MLVDQGDLQAGPSGFERKLASEAAGADDDDPLATHDNVVSSKVGQLGHVEIVRLTSWSLLRRRSAIATEISRLCGTDLDGEQTSILM